jgi:hypothetical protein
VTRCRGSPAAVTGPSWAGSSCPSGDRHAGRQPVRHVHAQPAGGTRDRPRKRRSAARWRAGPHVAAVLRAAYGRRVAGVAPVPGDLRGAARGRALCRAPAYNPAVDAAWPPDLPLPRVAAEPRTGFAVPGRRCGAAGSRRPPSRSGRGRRVPQSHAREPRDGSRPRLDATAEISHRPHRAPGDWSRSPPTLALCRTPAWAWVPSRRRRFGRRPARVQCRSRLALA